MSYLTDVFWKSRHSEGGCQLNTILGVLWPTLFKARFSKQLTPWKIHLWLHCAPYSASAQAKQSRTESKPRSGLCFLISHHRHPTSPQGVYDRLSLASCICCSQWQKCLPRALSPCLAIRLLQSCLLSEWSRPEIGTSVRDILCPHVLMSCPALTEDGAEAWELLKVSVPFSFRHSCNPEGQVSWSHCHFVWKKIGQKWRKTPSALGLQFLDSMISHWMSSRLSIRAEGSRRMKLTHVVINPRRVHLPIFL